jgi:hypothetical protein
MFRKSFLLLVVLMFSLTACQVQDEPLELSPALSGRSNGECQPELRYFSLNHSLLVPKTFLVKLETGPFQIGNCMCKVLNYKLEVSGSSGEQWDLLSSQGTTIPFEPSSNGPTDLLEIDDLQLIFEQYGFSSAGELFVKQAFSEPVPAPELIAAGGLCIIENFDGTLGFPIGASTDHPVLRQVPGNTPGTFSLEVWIPIGITNPI